MNLVHWVASVEKHGVCSLVCVVALLSLVLVLLIESHDIVLQVGHALTATFNLVFSLV